MTFKRKGKASWMFPLMQHSKQLNENSLNGMIFLIFSITFISLFQKKNQDLKKKSIFPPFLDLI